MFKNKLYSAAIFDLDGVIVDTAEFHYQAWKRLADELNIPFDRKVNHLLRGVERISSLNIILDNAGLALNNLQELADRKNEYYKQDISTITPNDILSGVLELLKTLRAKNISIGLASSSKNAKPVIKKLGIESLIDAVIDGYGFVQAKPAPDAFINCANKLKINPDSCVVIEDAQAGIDGAKAAGMFTVGVCNDKRLKNADLIIKQTKYLPLELFHEK